MTDSLTGGRTEPTLGGEATGVTASDGRPIGRRRGDRLVGASARSQQTVDQASSAARSPLPVLVVGPSGCGKEHVARAIHSWSSRASGPFVVLSIAGTPENLLQRELFGVGPEAEPLLDGSRDGALSRAAEGTLLLDGIDALPHAVRTALVQSMKDGQYRREGTGEPLPLSARIIATATSSEGDLLGDVALQTVTVAPLSERIEDVLPLAAHFLAMFAADDGLEPVGFTADARRWLLEEPWEGNVRELRERIRQALQLAGKAAISAEALMLSTEGDEVPSFKEAKRAFETRYVEGLLRRCGGNISRAARLAKKDRKDFYDVIRRTGVDPSEFRA